MATTSIDLTPFGFTATENTVYSRLLSGGPASGYAVAKDLLIARANAYQALRGLVAKGAASMTGDAPQRFRGVRPADLYATIVERQTHKLDRLETQLTLGDEPGASSFVPLSGERAFIELAGRTAAREPGPVTCLAPARLIGLLVPALRKRAADGAQTTIWSLGDPATVSLPLEGAIPAERAAALFGSPVAILLTGEAALLARLVDRSVAGYWTSDPSVVGATRGAMAALVAGAGTG